MSGAASPSSGRPPSRLAAVWMGPRTALVVFAAATIAMLTAMAITIVNPVADGLTARYFVDPSAPPVLTRLDPVPDTDAILAAWHGSPPAAFVATWNGILVVPQDGTYTFGINTAQHGSLSIDGRFVVDNAATGDPRLIIGDAVLGAGAHTVFLQYAHANGPVHLELLWGPSRGPLAPIPGSELHPRRTGPWASGAGRLLRSLLAVS